MNLALNCIEKEYVKKLSPAFIEVRCPNLSNGKIDHAKALEPTFPSDILLSYHNSRILLIFKINDFLAIVFYFSCSCLVSVLKNTTEDFKSSTKQPLFQQKALTNHIHFNTIWNQSCMQWKMCLWGAFDHRLYFGHPCSRTVVLKWGSADHRVHEAFLRDPQNLVIWSIRRNVSQ